MKGSDIDLALCLIAVDLNAVVSKQMLCGAAAIEVATDGGDGIGKSVDAPFAEIKFDVRGEDLVE